MSEGTIAHRIDLLVRGKAEFLRFLERRLGSWADAEELLQDALLKVVAHKTHLRDDEKLVPWFYQILHNLLVDHYRHHAAVRRLKDRVTADADTATEIDEELFQATYPCVNDVAATLKPEYGELIRRVEWAVAGRVGMSRPVLPIGHRKCRAGLTSKIARPHPSAYSEGRQVGGQVFQGSKACSTT